ncbi:MAG: twin-arginine translocase TatA/TatE family subunit [Candidatus Eremiobacteraeota bacterium]|nr:twin-arginine translocase TatA/TatE family subunit [Candidatus Eremiobacteraeota bacterium]
MLSVTEIAILGVGALLLFGPERLPGIMRKAGRVVRDVQNTSQSFIREMERAADDYEPGVSPPTAAEERQPENQPPS